MKFICLFISVLFVNLVNARPQWTISGGGAEFEIQSGALPGRPGGSGEAPPSDVFGPQPSDQPAETEAPAVTSRPKKEPKKPREKGEAEPNTKHDAAPAVTPRPVDQNAAFRPPKSFAPLNPVTERIWQFEDIDYENEVAVGEQGKKEANDCMGLHINCLINTPHVRHICIAQSFYESYKYTLHSQCELDYRNCLFRVHRGREVYGGDYTNDEYEFVAEGAPMFTGKPCS